MGIEYVVHINEKCDECFAILADRLKEHFPHIQTGAGCSIDLPSANSGWEDFSIEKREGGFFILSSIMSGSTHTELFRIMEKVLNEMALEYEIEEV